MASAGLVVLTGVTLAGCGSAATPTTNRVAEPGHNHADVAFAAEMVPHHEQGLHLVDLVDLAGHREHSARFADLTERIALEQAADIDEMETWLTTWDEPASPAPDDLTDEDTITTRSMTGAMRGMMRTRMGPWALGADDLDALGVCGSDRFEERWLRMMITHHQGAISMARHEMTHGEYPPAIALAEDVVTTQQAEIEEMRQLLRR